MCTPNGYIYYMHVYIHIHLSSIVILRQSIFIHYSKFEVIYVCVKSAQHLYPLHKVTRHILWSRSRVKLALGCPFFCSLRFFVSAFWVRFALFWRPCMRCMLFLVSLFVLCFCCARPWSCLVRGRLLQKHPRRLDIVYLASICKDGTGDLRTAFCLLHSSACLIQQLQDLDMAYSTQRLAVLTCGLAAICCISACQPGLVWSPSFVALPQRN